MIKRAFRMRVASAFGVVWIGVLALAPGCSKKADAPPAAPPDPARFATMTSERKCDATAPRAIPCTNELMVEALVAVSGDLTAEERATIERKMAATPERAGEPSKVHEITCQGDLDEAYVKGIVRCWAQPTCKAFAACVYSDPKLRLDLSPPPPPPTPAGAPSDAGTGKVQLVE
jgi:hypothetical protein